MDERLMIEWMELCVRLFTERKPAILMLDSFRGYLTKDVNAAMKKINVCPAVIPVVAAVRRLYQQANEGSCKATVARIRVANE